MISLCVSKGANELQTNDDCKDATNSPPCRDARKGVGFTATLSQW